MVIKMEQFNQELINFIKSGSCIFTCIKTIKEILKKQGYQELEETFPNKIKNGKYFIIRNDASIIAFKIKNNAPKFKIICTHGDTPSFLIKPNSLYYENNYLKLNVIPYGGILNYSFMDRPLSIAGKIVTKKKNEYQSHIIDLKKTVAIIPSVAIHQNDKANSNLDLNTQIDLMPIISTKKELSIEQLIKKYTHIKDSLFEYELYLYHNTTPEIINEELFASPRIDNLSCTYAALEAFLKSKTQDNQIFVVFNSEEIGSNSIDGADSNLLVDTLKKICANINLDFINAIHNSIIVSADNTHAKHPNHNELSDHTNTPPIHSGIIISKELNSTTNCISATILKHICEKYHFPYSYYTSRNDYKTGSTLASANLKHLSIPSIDIGLVMLAMHSSYELIDLEDIKTLYQVLKSFYEIKYQYNKQKINFL